jgi:erythromycin esterase
MTYRRISLGVLSWSAASVLASCHGRPVAATPPRPVSLTGAASYDDGAPAREATIAITDLDTRRIVDVLTTAADGSYQAALPPGTYALAVTTERGFVWVEKQEIPSLGSRLTLSRTCQPLTGRVDGAASSTRIHLERQSLSQGDTFVGPVRRDGSFAFCLPGGQYRAFLTGAALSVSTKVDLPMTSPLTLHGFAAREIKKPPPQLDRIPATRDGLVADILASDPKVVGLGEATHGSAEFFSARGELTLELIRRADVRLLLFEFDAIASAALDDYVNGGDVDPAKAVADLGFWITDTHEFLQFLEQLRSYNARAAAKVHIWGIDLQNTTHPVDVLVGNAQELSISEDDQATLKLLVKRGKGVRELSAAQRSSIDALLARLGTPRGPAGHDLRIAVAARSLATQLEYWTGEMETWLRKRRDAGMANLATFLVAQTGAPRACLWAHDAHVSKQPGELMLGANLARAVRYYAVGFYFEQGSTRAIDTPGKIGVISHPLPIAPKYTVESAVVEYTGGAPIAWLPLRHVPPAWQGWLAVPRFVRELGAVYLNEDDMLTLRDTRAAFDAVVVIRTVHESSPTPTGVRIFTH